MYLFRERVTLSSSLVKACSFERERDASALSCELPTSLPSAARALSFHAEGRDKQKHFER